MGSPGSIGPSAGIVWYLRVQRPEPTNHWLVPRPAAGVHHLRYLLLRRLGYVLMQATPLPRRGDS